MKRAATIRRSGGAGLLVLILMQHAAAPVRAQTANAPPDRSKKLTLPERDFPQAFVDIPFRSSVGVTGGQGLYHMVLSGDIPPGLIVETGPNVLAISGIPALAGTYDFRITAIGTDGTSVSRDYSFQVQSRLFRPLVMLPSPIVDTESFHFADGYTVGLPIEILDMETFHFIDADGIGLAVEIVDDENFHFSDGDAVGLPVEIVDNEAFHFSDGNTLPQPMNVQSITIGALPMPAYGGPAFSLTATSTSGLPVTIAVVSGPLIGPITGPYTPTGAGVATFLATQAGSANYYPTNPVYFNLSISPATLNVTPNNASRPFDQPNPPLTYTFTGLVNGDNSSFLSGAPTLTTTAVPISQYHSVPYPITISQGTLSATNYTINFPLSFNGLTITAAQSYITFYPLPNLTQGSAPFPLTARASSGQFITYTVTGPATVDSSTHMLTVTGAGVVTVTATTYESANYHAATPVVRSFTAQ